MAITLVAFVFTILILVGVHEGGHFVAAKLSGVYVHEFAIGFGPRILSFGKGETRYSVRAIPFGGYVRMAGEDRSAAADDIPQGRLFYSKHPLVRIFISLAGPTANLLTTLAVAVIALWIFGTPVVKVEDVIEGMPASAVLQRGDSVLAMEGSPVHTTDDLTALIQRSGGEAIDVTIVRDGVELNVSVTPQFDPQEERYMVGAYFWPIIRSSELDGVDPSSPLFRSGVRSGDKIVSIEGKPVATAPALIDAMIEVLPADSVVLTILREDEELGVNLTTAGIELAEALAGISFAASEVSYRRAGFTAGLTLGARQFASYVRMIAQWVHAILTGRADLGESIAGPVGIANLLGEGIRQGPNMFLMLFSYLSLSLGFLNLIPFPALDGSRAGFALYELLFRKKIPPEREGMIHAIGALVIIALMLLVTYKDIVNLFR